MENLNAADLHLFYLGIFARRIFIPRILIARIMFFIKDSLLYVNNVSKKEDENIR